jgi:hypothetical protein
MPNQEEIEKTQKLLDIPGIHPDKMHTITMSQMADIIEKLISELDQKMHTVPQLIKPNIQMEIKC